MLIFRDGQKNPKNQTELLELKIKKIN